MNRAYFIYIAQYYLRKIFSTIFLPITSLLTSFDCTTTTSKRLVIMKHSNNSIDKQIRLSNKQIIEVFHRVLKNNDGKCNFPVFLNTIFKLNIHRDTEFLRIVFESCDNTKKGILNENDFIIAYNIIYNHYMLPIRTMYQQSKVYLRAIRYGYSKVDMKYIFEVITGTCDELREKVMYSLDLRGFQLSKSSNTQLSKYTGNASTIVRLMIIDQQTNISNNSELKWWINLSAEPGASESVAAAYLMFGLPSPTISYELQSTQQILDTSIGVLTLQQHLLDQENKRTLQSSTFSIRMSAFYLRNVPVVEMYNNKTWALTKYYRARATMFRSHANLPCNEDAYALARAESFSRSFDHRSLSGLPPPDDYDDTSQRASSVTDSLLNDYNKDTSKRGSSRITANNDKSRTNDTEYFLLGVSDLLRLPPKVEAPSVQCHLINYGEGLNTLITFHTLEPSLKQDVSTSDPHAFFRENGHNTGSGIVGKLLCGVEKMLLECMKKEGIGHGADLAASSVSLLSAVTHAVQGFSSSSLTTLSAWMDALGNDMDSLAVSKHLFHIRAIGDILNGLKLSIEPYHKLLMELDSMSTETDTTSGTTSGTTLATDSALVLQPHVYMLTEENLNINSKSGTACLLTRIECMSNRLQRLKIDYTMRIEQKRDILSHVFGAFAILVAPIAVMTSYWGMNFDNMSELRGGYYTYVPGVTIVWVSAAVIYIALLLLAIHFRFFYIIS